MSTKLKFEIIGDSNDSFNSNFNNLNGFLPKANFEVILVEFNNTMYKVMGMREERSTSEEIDIVINYHIKEIKE